MLLKKVQKCTSEVRRYSCRLVHRAQAADEVVSDHLQKTCVRQWSREQTRP